LTPPGPAPAREVTLALVKYASPVAAASLPRVINAETVLQAASPACESARLLALSGLLIGLGIAHALAATIEAWLPAAGELSRGARVWQSAEWGIVALALGAGIIATVIPAWRAYRQDVAATLAEG
jgi:putative ABC transport system permease protein